MQRRVEQANRQLGHMGKSLPPGVDMLVHQGVAVAKQASPPLGFSFSLSIARVYAGVMEETHGGVLAVRKDAVLHLTSQNLGLVWDRAGHRVKTVPPLPSASCEAMLAGLVYCSPLNRGARGADWRGRPQRRVEAT